jgi:hypothetical protein
LRSQGIYIKECTAEVNALKGTPAVVRIGNGRFESAGRDGGDRLLLWRNAAKRKAREYFMRALIS